MALTLYGPDEPWPQHSKPWWRTALKAARAAGWHAEYLGAAHTWGYVKCPADEHVFKVDSTATNGASFAKDAETDVRECTHGHPSTPVSKVAERLDSATRLLVSAEQTVQVARDCFRAAQARLDALADLERVALLLATALANVELALDQVVDESEVPSPPAPTPQRLQAGHGEVERAVAAQEAALDLAVRLESGPLLDDVEDLLDQAQSFADEAAELTARIRREGLSAPLQARIVAVRGDIDALRGRIATLKDAIAPEDG